MKICGLITEYNPFHQGHKIHIDEAKQRTDAEYLIAVMSGNFVQRGEPAITSKYSRAECAIRNGVDLVIELPAIYATASAGTFAFGAVSILNALNLITDLCFGSQTDDIQSLHKISEPVLHESPRFKTVLKEKIKEGFSYPHAREKAVLSIIPDTPALLLKDANSLLGIEYIKALIKTGSRIRPHTYIRKPGFQASDIRRELWELSRSISQDKPPMAAEDLRMKSDDFSYMLQYRMLSHSFEHIYGMTESLYRKILKNRNNFHTFEQLAELLKSKDITKTHIKRALIHTLLNISSNDMSFFNHLIPKYFRVLACSERGKTLLKLLSKACDFPIITNPNQRQLIKDTASLRAFDIDLFATEVYNAAVAVKYRVRTNEYRQNPFF